MSGRFDTAAYEAEHVLPIQIREDVTVRVSGIPHNLTGKEAAKIARVVLAMAAPAARISDTTEVEGD